MRSSAKLLSSLLFSILLTTLTSEAVLTQTVESQAAGPNSSALPVEEDIRVGNRTVGDFTFIPSIYVKGPFTGTFVSTFTGYGLAPKIDMDLYDREGNYVSTIGGDLNFLILQFAYQQKIVDWLSVNFMFAGSARVGSGFEAMMSEGLSAIFDMGFGGIARIYKSKRFYGSVSLNYQEQDLTLVTPLEFARKILEDQEINKGNLVQDLVSSETMLGLHAAYTPLHWLGIQGELSVGAGDLPEAYGGERVLYHSGVTLDMDFGRLTPVELGIQLLGRLNRSSKGSNDLEGKTAFWGIGFFFTGRENFSIGLNYTLSRYKHRKRDAEYSASVINVFMRYDI